MAGAHVDLALGGDGSTVRRKSLRQARRAAALREVGARVGEAGEGVATIARARDRLAVAELRDAIVAGGRRGATVVAVTIAARAVRHAARAIGAKPRRESIAEVGAAVVEARRVLHRALRLRARVARRGRRAA